MLSRLLSGHFVKLAVIAIVILFSITSYLFVENKAKHAKITLTENQLFQQRQANQHLSEQLAQANQQIVDYFKQTKALQQKVENQRQAKQEKADEILQILAKHKNWAVQSVPDDVSRVFQQSNLQSNKARSALPDRKSVPTTTNQY